MYWRTQFDFFRNKDKPRRGLERVADERRELFEELRGLLVALRERELPASRQGIVQKMRIYLGLECQKFRILEAVLIGEHAHSFFHKRALELGLARQFGKSPLDAVLHVDEGVMECADLIFPLIGRQRMIVLSPAR